MAASSRPSDDITRLLREWRGGAPEAGDALMERVQRELRQIAASYLRRERSGHSLQPTAIVNEAYLRLVPQRTVHWENRAHFFGIAARMMRRVLVVYSRRRRAAERGGPARAADSLGGGAAPGPPSRAVPG